MSSRICVKNLPKKCTEVRLREHFAAQGGEITDIRIMRKADGSSRMFGFVGYKTDKMAGTARNHFHNTFMGTVKITVEDAMKRGDEALARPWSKHSKGSSAFDTRNKDPAVSAEEGTDDKRKGAGRERAKVPDDPKLREYLALMNPKGSAGKFWAGDGDVASGDATAEGFAPRRPLKAVTKQLQVPNRKTGGEGQLVTKTHVTFEDDEPAESDDEYQVIGADEPDQRAQLAAPTAGMSDLDYLRSKQKPASLSGDDEEDDDEDDDEDGEEEEDGEEGGVQAASEEPDAEEEEEEGEGGAADRAEGEAGEGVEAAAGGVDDIDLAETGRLFVRNLSYDVNDAEVKNLFRKFGPLADVHVPVDSTTKRGKGFAYAQFMLPEHAVRALAELDATIFQGRIIHLIPARLQRAAVNPEGEGGGFKATQEAARRAAAQQPIGWNSLFMGADAVANATAESFGMSKAQLLGPDAEDAAVRLALGETSIVAMTKAWFRAHGLNAGALDALDKARETAANAGKVDIARSRSTILVKNLPPGANEQMLHAQFGRYGTVSRLLLPPARTLALIEYAAVPEARKAFSGMAYRKLAEGHQPLYLEWAPQALLEAPPDNDYDSGAAAGARDGAAGEGAESGDESEEEAEGEKAGKISMAAAGAKRVAEKNAKGGKEGKEGERSKAKAVATAAAAEAEEGSHGDDVSAAGAGRAIYVKNLNFKTDEGALRALFEKRYPDYPVKSVIIARKADRRLPGKTLSMGYGFVEFASREHAREVIKAAGSDKRPLALDEHTLALKLSTHSTGATAAAKGARAAVAERKGGGVAQGKPSRKLTVRNVPFEASKRELKELFGSFGEVSSVRMPKKFDGKHRGFAFIEYLSKQDAAKAMDALGNTHLYGRHLVLEWAADEQSMDALRDKAKRNLDASQKATDAKRLRAAKAADEGDVEFDRDGDAGMADQMLAY